MGSSISSKKRTNEFVFTSMRRVFVGLLEEIEDSKKAFRNYLTFTYMLCFNRKQMKNIVSEWEAKLRQIIQYLLGNNIFCVKTTADICRTMRKEKLDLDSNTYLVTFKTDFYHILLLLLIMISQDLFVVIKSQLLINISRNHLMKVKH